MGSDILSQSELDNLLSAISSPEDHNDCSEDYNDDFNTDIVKSSVKMYDFKRPDKFSKKHLTTFKSLFENFSRNMSKIFSSYLGCQCTFIASCIDQLTFEEFLRSVPNPSTLAVIDSLDGKMIIEIDPTVSFAFIDRLCGGEGVLTKYHRPLTYIEKYLIQTSIITRSLGCLRGSFLRILDLRPTLKDIETNIDYCQIVNPNDIVLLATIEAKVAESESMINVMIPYSTLEPVIDKFKPSSVYDSNEIVYRNELESNLLESEVTLKVVLAKCFENFKDVNSYKIGDIIKFDTKEYESLPLYIQDKKKFKVRRVLKEQAYNKVKIVESIEKNKDKNKDIEECETNECTDIQPNRASKTNLKRKKKVSLPFFKKILKIFNKPQTYEYKPFNIINKNIKNNKHFNTDLFINILKNQHPRITALILIYLEDKYTKVFLKKLPENMRCIVIETIATTDYISPESIMCIESVLLRQLFTVASSDFTTIEGISKAQTLLTSLNKNIRESILRYIKASDPYIYEKLIK